MTLDEFEFVARLVRRECGLVLAPDKTYLVESRLVPVARRRGAADVGALVRAVMARATPDLVREIVEAMVTNETFFFRDRKPFDQFRDSVLPHLSQRRVSSKVIRIWCAACSSGQEPYSLAILCREAAVQLSGWDIEILATDLSTEVLQQAKAGLYSQFEVQRGLPIHMLVKYFRQVGDKWQVNESIRAMVTFRQFNLLGNPSGFGSFDVVFCRNVLIYFDQPTKAGILERIAGLMPPDGFLFLGGAETVLGLSTRFQPVPDQRGMYGLTTATPAMRMAVG